MLLDVPPLNSVGSGVAGGVTSPAASVSVHFHEAGATDHMHSLVISMSQEPQVICRVSQIFTSQHP